MNGTIPAPYTPVPWPDDPEADDAPDFTWQGNYARAKECVEACEGMAFPLDQIADLQQQDRLKTREINTLVPENRSLIDRNAKLTAACKLVLLFHSASPWDDEKKQEWANGLTDIMGVAAGRDPKVVGANGDGTWDGACPTNEATTKNLCNAVRAALAVQ